MEDEFSCQGICRVGAFFYFRKIQEGPPTKNCLTGLKETFKDKPLAIGIILLVSFALTFFAFITTFSLCYRKDK